MDRTWELIRKEWSEVFKNKMVFFAVAFMPLLFTIIPLVTVSSMGSSGDLVGGGDIGEAAGQMGALCEGLSGGECGQYLILLQFLLMYLLMPVIIPVTIASYSIVGEKTTRTLEPLLATPISTLELLAGKALAAVIPAIGVTWLAFGIFITGTNLLGLSPTLIDRLFDPIWLLAIFLIGPLLSLLSISLAIMISSRVSDPRVAEQLSVLVVMPLLLIIFGQTFGWLEINLTFISWFAAILFFLDAVALYFSIQLFQRETILTRWK